MAGCVSSSDPNLPQAPAKDGGRQRLLGWGGEPAAENPPWGRLATGELRLQAPGTCAFVPPDFT